MQIKGGYYIKARIIQESDISKAPPYVREIWDWLLMQANHASTPICERGQTIRTFKDIQEGLAWYAGWRKHTYTKDQCEKAMKWLRKATMIATKKTTRGMVINIVNYCKYQDPKNYESNNESHTKATVQQQSADTINKNDKNVKNEKNIIKNTIDTCEQSSQDIVDIINIFKTINPTINFGNKTTRKAAADLIKQFGKEKTLEYANYAISVFGTPYAPQITTPYELREKLSKLAGYHNALKTKDKKINIIDLDNL